MNIIRRDNYNHTYQFFARLVFDLIIWQMINNFDNILSPIIKNSVYTNNLRMIEKFNVTYEIVS